MDVIVCLSLNLGSDFVHSVWEIMVRNKWIYIKAIAVLFFVWISLTQTGAAQQYDFKHYSVADGLPHGQVSMVVEGADHQMWFGTMGGGLSRFNGTEFHTYTQKDGLRDSYVTALAEDTQQRLWVATYQGGVGTLEEDSLRYRFTDSALDTVVVYNIRESPEGNIWFATYGAGAFVYNGRKLTQYTTKSGLISNTVWDFYFNDSGKIWISTHAGVSICHDSTIKDFEGNDRLNGKIIYRIHEGPNGNWWFGTNNGVTKFDGHNYEKIYTVNGDSIGYVYDIIHDYYGNIWIGSESKGVFRQFGGNGFHRVDGANGLSSNYVYNLYRDHKDHIWIATDEAGVNLYRGDEFVWFTKEKALSAEDILSVNEVREGVLWVGTASDGLWEITTHAASIRKKQIGLKGKEVWAIEKLPDGNKLLLTGDNRIWEYDGASFTDFNKKMDVPVEYTVDLFVDSAGEIWIGTDSGIYHIRNGTVRHLTEKDGLVDNFIWEVTEDREGQIWISTNDGISTYDDNTFTNFTMEDGLNQNVISTITQDEEGGYWVGTTAGISYMPALDQSDTLFVNFGKEEGMEFINTQFLAFDSNGYLWQGTRASLQRLNVPKYQQTGNMEIISYNFRDQIEDFEFTHKAVEIDSSGNMWFGSTKGLLRYDPTVFDRDTAGPDVKITDVLIGAQSWEKVIQTNRASGNTKLSSSPELDDSQNDLTFTFSALEYEYPEKSQFRYRLQGFEKDWNGPTQIQETVYRNVDPGEYNFTVQARNQQGAWGPVNSVAFSIAPPFWNTYWFYGLVALSVIGLGYAYIRMRVNLLEKKRLQELVDYKTKGLQKALTEKEVLIQEIHHRVKNNLAVISGLLELQMGSADDDYIIRTLAESQRRVQSIAMIHEKLYQNEDLAEIDFKKYIKELLDIIVYSIDKDDKNIELEYNIDQIDLGIDQAIPCGLILNEVVSNAFEHAFNGSNSGTIWVDFLKNGDNIIFKIKDNGTGLPEDLEVEELDSLGLVLVNSLVQQLEGNLELQTSEEGTIFNITFEKAVAKRDLPI